MAKVPLVNSFMPQSIAGHLLTPDKPDILTSFREERKGSLSLCQDVSGCVRDFPEVLMLQTKLRSTWPFLSRSHVQKTVQNLYEYVSTYPQHNHIFDLNNSDDIHGRGLQIPYPAAACTSSLSMPTYILLHRNLYSTRAHTLPTYNYHLRSFSYREDV